MANNMEFNANSHRPDLAHLIRSIQRLEGNPDCFGPSCKCCERQDCAWREYGLKAPLDGVFNKDNTKS